jgi:hypothetical protein
VDFLCDFKKVATLSTEDLTKHCSDVELALENNDSCTDIDKMILINFGAFHNNNGCSSYSTIYL